MITTTHLFIGMTMKSGSWLLKMLNDMGVTKEQIAEWLGFVTATSDGEEIDSGRDGIHLSQFTKNTLLALVQAGQRPDRSNEKITDRKVLSVIMNLSCSLTDILTGNRIDPQTICRYMDQYYRRQE